MFYTLWSAKCKNIASKALSVTCKVHVICRLWLDLWFVVFCNKIWMWNVFYLLVFVFPRWSSSLLSSLLRIVELQSLHEQFVLKHREHHKWVSWGKIILCVICPLLMAQGEFRILNKLESSTISTMFFSFSLAHLFVSMHAFDENCENLILFEILVFSQGVSLGSFA